MTIEKIAELKSWAKYLATEVEIQKSFCTSEDYNVICPPSSNPFQVAESYEKFLKDLGKDCHVKVVNVPILIPHFSTTVF